jgi:hypothetical protein
LWIYVAVAFFLLVALNVLFVVCAVALSRRDEHAADPLRPRGASS